MIKIEVFKLFGSILVDSSKAEQSISKTEQKAEGLGSKLGHGISTAGKWGMAIAGGAAVAGAAIGGVVMKATDAAGALDDTSKRIGMSAEEYQKYAYAAKLSGMETDKLEGAMKKQQKAFDDAKTGGEKAGEAYKKLGIDIGNIGSSGEAFDSVVKKLAGMKDVNERNVLANQIFGKSYADLLPLMADGAEGIDKMKQEAVDMGAVMSNESVAAGAKFGDTLDSLKMAGSGIVNELGSQMMPYFQKAADWVMNHMPEIKKAVSEAFSVIKKVVKTAADVFQALLPILKPIWDFVSWAFPKILDTVSSVFGAIKPIVEGVGTAFEVVADAIKWAYEKWQEWTGRKDDKKVKIEEPGGNTSKNPRNIHASGLAYVPYDGYEAILHKGERVLSRGDVANNTMNHSGTIRLEGINDSGEMVAAGNFIMNDMKFQLSRGQRRNP